MIAAASIISMTACQSFRGYPKPVVPEKTELKNLVHYFTDDVETQYKHELLSGEASGKAYRDEVISERLRAIDIRFVMFTAAINKEANGTGMLADFAVLGLSGGGAVAGGAATKAILAAISGGITGAELSINKTLYYQKTLPALLAQMEASRIDQLATMRAGMQKSTSDYPLATALHDVDRYYLAGTLPDAITAIGVAAGAKSDAAAKDIKNLTVEGTYTKDDATTALLKRLMPQYPKTTVVDLDFRDKLQKWIADSKNGVPKDSNGQIIDPSEFLYLPQYAAQRKVAAVDPTLSQ